MKKRLTALLCAAVLCLSLFPARAINVGDVYFTAVNDKLVLPLSMDTMPTWVKGVLYVPATVFDSTATGVNLGLYCSQSSTNNTVTLYTLKQMLVFDLSRGTAYDHHSGQSVSARAVNRNGRIYLPVEPVCKFFGLEDSYNYTQYGYLVRIKNDAAWLNDADFMDAASVPMASNLQELLRSQQPSVQPPTPPTTVDPPVIPNDKPELPPGGEEQPKAKAQVCLAFRCETGEGLEQILNRLDEDGCKGIFFVAPELLLQQDNLVRRVIGSGHSLGLLAGGDTSEESLRQMKQDNAVLKHIARTAATAVLAPSDQREALAAENWACWRETVNGTPRENERVATCVQRIIRNIGTRSRTVYVTLDDSEKSAQVLNGLLSTLLDASGQKEYHVLAPVETRI